MGSSSHVRQELDYVSKVSGSHRDPKYWPTKPSKTTDDAHDLNIVRPGWWLVKIASDGTQPVYSETESEDEADFGGFTGQVQDTIRAILPSNERFISPIL